MYNEERKESFIKSYTDNPRTAYYIRSIFKKFGKYEDDIWKEDVCLQPKETLEPIINNETGTRTGSAERALVVLKDYVKWCAKNAIEVSDGVFNIRVDVVQAVYEQMVASPLHLKRKLNQVFGDPDDNTIACIYKAYYWLAFAGLSDVEALKVTVDEIDFSDLVVRHNEKIYQLYQEAKGTLKKACTLTEFEYEHTNYSKPSTKPRSAGNELIRGTNGAMKLSAMRVITTRKVKSTGEKLSYKKIFYSGIFNRVYEEERAGGGVSFEKYVADLIATNNYTFNRNRTINKVANSLIRALEIDYDKWKCAFNI